MYNKRMLKSYVVRYGDTYDTLAKAMGVSTATISSKMCGKRNFNLEDIQFLANRYDIEPVDIVKIFLPKVSTISRLYKEEKE